MRNGGLVNNHPRKHKLKLTFRHATDEYTTIADPDRHFVLAVRRMNVWRVVVFLIVEDGDDDAVEAR
jgi:hypothetical protein